MDEQPDSTEMVSEFFGERQGFSDQPRDALTQGVVEAFDVVGLTTFFADMVQRLGIEDGVVSLPEVHISLGVQVALGQALPESERSLIVT